MCNNNNSISNIKIIRVNKEGPIGLPALNFNKPFKFLYRWSIEANYNVSENLRMSHFGALF